MKIVVSAPLTVVKSISLYLHREGSIYLLVVLNNTRSHVVLALLLSLKKYTIAPITITINPIPPKSGPDIAMAPSATLACC